MDSFDDKKKDDEEQGVRGAEPSSEPNPESSSGQEKATETTRTWYDGDAQKFKRKGRCKGPSYLSYLDEDDGESPQQRRRQQESSRHNQQNQPLPQQQQQQQQQHQLPGAYSGAPGEGLRRRDEISFSLVGASVGVPEQETPPPPPATITTRTTTTFTNATSGNTPSYNRHHNNNAIQFTTDRVVSDSKLAVARLVPVQLLEDAQEMNSEELERTLEKQKREKNKRQFIFLIGSISLCIIGVAIIAVLFGTNVLDHSSSKETNNNQLNDTSTSPYTQTKPAATAPISDAPSFAPSGALDLLKDALPEYTLESMKVFDSPQWKAWDWLTNHQNLSSLKEWRKKQLFALATFFYSFEGEKWYLPIQERWLDDTKDECQWFSSGFGYFDDEGVYMDQQPQWRTMPCSSSAANDTEDGGGGGKFISLHLENLQLWRNSPKMPPEITLLADSLSTINMGWNEIEGTMTDMILPPSQLAQMTKLTEVMLNDNNLRGPLPSSELGALTKLTRLYLYKNSLTGHLPSEIGLMRGMMDLDFHSNGLRGKIPLEIQSMTKLTSLWLETNRLSGPLPRELFVSSMKSLNLLDNYLSGSIPPEVGRMVNATYMWLRMNQFDHTLPSELGRMTSLAVLWLDNNLVSGSIPSQLALITSLEILRLENNFLSGTIPPQLTSMAINGSLRALTLADNSLYGTIPEALCSLGMFDSRLGIGLSFDCNQQLCGCCWCPCPRMNYGTECQANPFLPYRDAAGWPGTFPAPFNETNAIVINLQSDSNAQETSFQWSMRDKWGSWKILESGRAVEPNALHSYTMEVESDSAYRLELFDEYADGTCCEWGLGWMTITTSTPTNYHVNGMVVWEAAGYDLEEYLEVILSIDSNGRIMV